MLLRYGLSCLILSTALSPVRAQNGQGARRPFIAGEVLQYKVKWTYLRLGTVTITQTASDSGLFLIHMSVRSNPSLPFIDVNFRNHSMLSERSQSLTEEVITSGKDTGEKTVYWFDRATRQLLMEDSLLGRRTRRDSLSWVTECYDALGLLMLSRLSAGSGKSVSLPTLNDYKINQTDVSYTNLREETDVPVFNARRRCVVVSGYAHWVGSSFAGMRGPFRGWFTDDEAAIPVRAEVDILLGAITLELESYHCSDSPGRTTTTAAAR